MLTDGIEGVKEKVFVLVTGANRYSETPALCLPSHAVR
jgi:hypothetical protein